LTRAWHWEQWSDWALDSACPGTAEEAAEEGPEGTAELEAAAEGERWAIPPGLL